MDSNELELKQTKVLAMGAVVIILGMFTGCTVEKIHEDRVIAEMVSDGADPVTVRCALTKSSTCDMIAISK